MKDSLRLIFVALAVGAFVGCAGAQVQLAGSPVAEDAPEAGQIREAVQGYIAANPGDLAGTFDVPGGEQESAAFQSYVAIHRTDNGYLARARFQDMDHTYDVDFALSNGGPPAVSTATLALLDGNPAE